MSRTAIEKDPVMNETGSGPSADYPFEPCYLDLPGGRMHYVDQGSGPAVLLIHGTPTWSFLYRHLITALSTDHRVIAPDHLGFGRSDKPAGAARGWERGQPGRLPRASRVPVGRDGSILAATLLRVSEASPASPRSRPSRKVQVPCTPGFLQWLPVSRRRSRRALELLDGILARSGRPGSRRAARS